MHKNKLFLLLIIVCTTIIFSCEHETYMQGKRLYATQCASCHGEQGEGLEMLIPPLAKVDYVKNNQRSFACIIKNGLKGEISVNGNSYNQIMEGLELSDVQITNIINYINHAWGNDYGEVSLPQIKTDLKNCN